MCYDSICPDCIEPLKRQSKKLGHLSAWLVCPKCGFRTREQDLICENDTKYTELRTSVEYSQIKHLDPETQKKYQNKYERAQAHIINQ